MNEWRLEGAEEEPGVVSRIALRPLPFLVGRRGSAQLRLSSSSVSIEHATLFERDGRLWIKDLGSTNGTFVNGEPVSSERCLETGDILHFAEEEFRVSMATVGQLDELTTGRMELTAMGIDLDQVHQTRQFLEALHGDAVRTAFQPVLELSTSRVVAFEALGRIERQGVPSLPGDLFSLAQRLSLVRQLSNAFRRQALAEAPRLPSTEDKVRPAVLINTHPLEVVDSAELLADLGGFRTHHPEVPVVLEIHEAALADMDDFVRLRSQLRDLDIGLAFDDFGKGAARLNEICEAAPDYVKFDRSFAAEIHTSERRAEMTRALVAMMKQMKIISLLEGVETEAEDAACRKIGFQLGQGYFYGRPAALEDLLARRS